jgi:hypothetical protein
MEFRLEEHTKWHRFVYGRLPTALPREWVPVSLIDTNAFVAAQIAFFVWQYSPADFDLVVTEAPPVTCEKGNVVHAFEGAGEEEGDSERSRLHRCTSDRRPKGLSHPSYGTRECERAAPLGWLDDRDDISLACRNVHRLKCRSKEQKHDRPAQRGCQRNRQQQ